MSQTAPVAAPPSMETLSQRQKAAIIVKLLVGGGTSLDDLELNADSILKITNAMTGLGVVTKDIVDGVTAEFIIEMEQMGLVFDIDIDGSLSSMSGQMSQETLDRIRDQRAGTADEAAWRLVSRTDADRLGKIVSNENPRIAAVILSKLKVSKSAEVAGKIDPEKAQAIMEAIINTTQVSAEVVGRIGLALEAQIGHAGGKDAFDSSAAERIGAILNVSRSKFREDILDNFDQKDPETADEIRKLMFTFADIPSRVTPRDISKFLRAVEDDDIIAALSGAVTSSPETYEFIISNISSRMAAQLTEGIEDRGDVKPKDVDAAMTNVVIAIQDLEKTGEITLTNPAEEGEEE